jgi:hypothetical protein
MQEKLCKTALKVHGRFRMTNFRWVIRESCLVGYNYSPKSRMAKKTFREIDEARQKNQKEDCKS